MQQSVKILFHIYMKLNMFRATHCPSSGARTALAASGFSYVEGCWTCSWRTLSGTVCNDKVVGRVVGGRCQAQCA